jgi:hypothetical protein
MTVGDAVGAAVKPVNVTLEPDTVATVSGPPLLFHSPAVKPASVTLCPTTSLGGDENVTV